MEHHDLEAALDRANRASVHVVTTAGLLSGLLLGIGYLGLRDGESLSYEEIHKVVGCGSLVAVLSKMNFAGTDMAVIDIFRVDDGRIVEHWDVMEEILPEDQWVNSGKF